MKVRIALLCLCVVGTAFTSAEEDASITFANRDKRTTKIFGTFEMGKQDQGTGDMKCFSGYSAMKECCLADKFGNCVAGPSAVQGEGPFMENILANAGYSSSTGMVNWQTHAKTGLCVECCDQTRLAHGFYDTFRLVCPKSASDSDFNAFINEQKAGEVCNDGEWNQNEEGVDCGGNCVTGEAGESCTVGRGDDETPKCEQVCTDDDQIKDKTCGGPDAKNTEWISDSLGGQCYYHPDSSAPNLPGCPPGSTGKLCDKPVLCPSALNNDCPELKLGKDCWPNDTPGETNYCENGCDPGEIPVWNYKEESWGCGAAKSAAAGSSSSSGGLFVFRFARRQTDKDDTEVTCTLEYDPGDRIGTMVGYDLILLVEERKNPEGDWWVGVNACRAYPIFQGEKDHTITDVDRAEVLRHPSTKGKMDNEKAKWERSIQRGAYDSLVQRIHVTNLVPECQSAGAWTWKQDDWDLLIKDKWPHPTPLNKKQIMDIEDPDKSPVYTEDDEKSKTDGGAKKDLSNPSWYTPRPDGVCAGCTQSVALSLFFGLTLRMIYLME